MIGYGNSMFLATHGILARTASGGGVDPDAQAFITAAAITDPTQQSAINTLVVDLKGYNIWSKMKALYPMVGGTSSSHKWNLKDPRDLDAAYRLVFNGGWTHSANGALPNGTNGFANTFLTPSTTLTASSAHFSKYNRTNDLVGSQKVDGCVGVAGATFMQQNYVSANGLIGEVGAVISYTATDTRGLFTITRTSTNTQKLYRNLTSLGTSSFTINNIPAFDFYIGARNDASVATSFNSYQCAFASIGDGLTDTEAANFYTAVQAFQTTLGRSIGTQTVSDADAQAFVTNAGIVDQVEANAINNLVIGMKADGLWTKMKAVYPMVGGSSSTMKYNLKNPLDTDAAFRLVFNGGWTFSANGATPNGTNGYADTFYNLSTQSTTSNVSGGVYLRTNVINNGASFGVRMSNLGLALYPKISDQNTYWAVNDSLLTGPSNIVSDTRGLFVLNKISLTEKRIYKNGSQIATATPSSNSAQNANVWLGAANNFGSYDSREQAFAFLGDTLTNTEVANLYTRVQNFNTALARQV